jgi:anti-sigma factor RsiW
MHDDDVMDRLLRAAMAADAPQLSPAFDARVMRRVRPRRLTPKGRVVMALYAVVAAAAAVWLMGGLPLGLIVAAAAIGVPIAAAAGAYVRRLAAGRRTA